MLLAPAMVTLVLVALVPFLYTVYLSLQEMQYSRVGEWAGVAFSSPPPPLAVSGWAVAVSTATIGRAARGLMRMVSSSGIRSCLIV